MIGLNLLPDVKKEFIKAQRTRNTVISISILAMLIVGGATTALAIFVYFGQTTAITLQNNAIKDNQAKLEAKPEIAKYLTIQSQLEALHDLHGKDYKSTFSRLFGYIIKLNPAAPYSISLGTAKIVDEGSKITMQGSANDFRSVDVFKNTLEKAKLTYKTGDASEEAILFTEVVLKNASLTDSSGKTRVTFEFDLTYSPEAFRPDISDVQLVVEKQVISDAKDNAPSQLFNTQPGGN